MKTILSLFFGILLMCSECEYSVAGDVIKIGGLLPLTGVTAPSGIVAKNTLELLVKQSNIEGGIAGHKLELVIYDTAGLVKNQEQLSAKLVKEDKVSVIILGFNTINHELRVVVEQESIPVIALFPAIGKGTSHSRWIFNTYPNVDLDFEKLISAVTTNKRKNIALIVLVKQFHNSNSRH